jgi:transposase
LGPLLMARHQKKARKLNARIVFIDESGLLLHPHVRRTWAPTGKTPVFYQKGRSYKKATIIGALSVSPRKNRTRLYFSVRPNANVDKAWFIRFLTELARHLRPHPLMIVWDRLPGHRSKAVTASVHGRRRLSFNLLPAYAPELNPVEVVWAYLKTNPLSNLALDEPYTLAKIAKRHAWRIANKPQLLYSFLRSTPLFYSK